MLLHRFANEEGWLFVFNKRCPERGVFRQKPAQVFVENHLYTQHELDGSKDYSVEFTLSRLESVANGILEKIVRAARSKNTPRLNWQERQTWDLFFCSQVMRVPDIHPSEEHMDTILRQSVNQMLRDARLPPQGADYLNRILDSNQDMSQFKRNIKASLAIPTEVILNVVSERGIGIARIRKSKSSFVIGSMPVVRLAREGRTHLADPTVEAWLPIAPDVAVTPASSRGEEKLVEITQNRFVRYINESTFTQSTSIAGRSPELVRSLARDMIAASN